MTKRLKLVILCFHIKVANVSTFRMINLTAKFEGVPSIDGLKLGWGGFDFFRVAISPKRCKVETVFRLDQTSMTSSDLEGYKNCYISDMGRDKAQVTINHEYEIIHGFRFVEKSMTLNGKNR